MPTYAAIIFVVALGVLTAVSIVLGLEWHLYAGRTLIEVIDRIAFWR